MKVLYLIAIHRKRNRENITGRIGCWKQILNTLTTTTVTASRPTTNDHHDRLHNESDRAGRSVD